MSHDVPAAPLGDPVPADLPANASVPQPRVWTVFLAALTAIVAAVVFQALVGGLLAAWHIAKGVDSQQLPDKLASELATPGGFMLMAACGQLGFGLTCLIAALLSPVPIRERLGLLPPNVPRRIYPLSMLGSLAALAIGIAVVQPLTFFLPGDPSAMRLYENMTLEIAVPFVLFIAIFPGIIEELLFRGYIQRRLLERWSPAWAVAVTSLLFAAAHVMPLAIVSLLPLAIWLGLVAWRTNSVYPAIACHMFVNGSVNAWRLFVKFAEIPEAVQAAVVVTTLIISAACFIVALRSLFADREPVLSTVAPATSPVSA